jgi:hypothetical protein
VRLGAATRQGDVMETAEFKAVCSSVDLDLTTGHCSVIQWVPNTVGGFPVLSAAEGLAISGAIGAVWAIGFVIRTLRHTARG